jgi:hypothetical protein
MKKLDGSFPTFTMSAEEYAGYEDEMIGLCLTCGAERYGCEPDAREYPCEECEALAVYGVPELLIMGEIEITDDEDEDDEAS